ncbi:MAG: ABC transporter substrate-binding protein, partial [Acidimicrobiia bacterium]|nr:ABC transporter substrate-binding protein [Acidimicrobiia bacterium]
MSNAVISACLRTCRRENGRPRPRATGRFRHPLALLTVAVALVLVGCSSSDDGAATTTTTADGAGSTTTVDRAGPTTTDGAGPTTSGAPVDTEPITLGVTYVDTEALSAVGLNFDLGDHAAVYEALVADINESGGINGRSIELVLAGVDPTGAEGAEAACLKLTEDEGADLLTGFFLNDAVLCPLELQGVPVVGGEMTPDRVERAQAPWITWSPDWQRPEDVTRTFAEGGELEGTVAVFAASADKDSVDDVVLPTLDELGIDVVETGILDAPPSDTNAVREGVQLIGERFESSGVDTVVLVGNSAENWPSHMSDN